MGKADAYMQLGGVQTNSFLTKLSKQTGVYLKFNLFVLAPIFILEDIYQRHLMRI
jgi:hypothetical protein